MAITTVGLNDAKAVKRWSAKLMVDIGKKAYFTKKFMGDGPDSPYPIQRLTDLESEAGDQISFDLSMQLKQEPTEGDDTLEGNEEALIDFTDTVYIDQARHGVNAGGRMTRKRTLHNLRTIARNRLSDYWSRVFDEQFFMYLSGGPNTSDKSANYIFKASYTGRGNNAFTAPDADHIVYGDGTTKATVTAAGVVTADLISKVKTKADVQGGGSDGLSELRPIMVEGEEHHCLVMHPWSAFDLRTASGASNWLELQKAAAGATGNKSAIFKGALGLHDGVVLHSHKSVIRYGDYGAGSNVDASRALFLGAQAGVIAFGSPGSGLRFDWHEETDDRGNQLVVTSNVIFGIKKCQFNSDDFGIISVDVAAAAP